MGITVAGPGFGPENDPSTELCANAMVRFEHFLCGPVSDPQTACSADVSVAPRHSTAQRSTPHHTTPHHTTPHHTTYVEHFERSVRFQGLRQSHRALRRDRVVIWQSVSE